MAFISDALGVGKIGNVASVAMRCGVATIFFVVIIIGSRFFYNAGYNKAIQDIQKQTIQFQRENTEVINKINIETVNKFKKIDKYKMHAIVDITKTYDDDVVIGTIPIGFWDRYNNVISLDNDKKQL